MRMGDWIKPIETPADWFVLSILITVISLWAIGCIISIFSKDQSMMEHMTLPDPIDPPEPVKNLPPIKEDACILPDDAEQRKTYPVYSGVFQYFPDAILAVAKCSYEGNQQHHPDKPLHWDKSKSTDELDAMLRHTLEGDWDKVAWRALANLQRKIEQGKQC